MTANWGQMARSAGVARSPYDVRRWREPISTSGRSEFIDSLMDTELYSIGAYFCDEHPELVDEVIALSEEIERRGLEAYAADGDDGDASLERTFETLLTGLAVRYYKAVAGVSAWIPRVLLGLGVIGVAGAIYSISVGSGGPQSQAIGGVNDVQRIFGGIFQEGAYLGPEDAETTITVFNDIQCAPCAEFEIETVDPLVEEYARTGEARLEFRHFSLAPNDTTLAAIAAEAAGLQSRQWQYLDTFVRNIDLVSVPFGNGGNPRLQAKNDFV